MIIHALGTSGVIELPNPLLEDTRTLQNQVQLKYAMDETIQTHVKRNSTQVFSWQFVLTEMKMFEFQAFHVKYHGVEWRIIDWNDQIIVGYIKTNPLEFTPERRGKYYHPTNANKRAAETVAVAFEFEGIYQ